jgi:hypothetical protein
MGCLALTIKKPNDEQASVEGIFIFIVPGATMGFSN